MPQPDATPVTPASTPSHDGLEAAVDELDHFAPDAYKMRPDPDGAWSRSRTRPMPTDPSPDPDARPLTAEEEAAVRRDHRSAITHVKRRCQVCRLLATLDAARAASKDTGDAGLREAAQAYIDWRDKRLAQWNAVARHDHEHGMTPCPEWDELTSEPFDIDQRLDDAIRAALSSTAEAARLHEVPDHD